MEIQIAPMTAHPVTAGKQYNARQTSMHAITAQPPKAISMDKKTKKRIDVINTKLQNLRKQLSGAKQQPDDPDEPARLEKEIAALEAESAKLKAS